MIGRKSHYLVLCGSLFLAPLAGCEHKSSPNLAPAVTPSSATEMVTILIGGNCHASPSSIVCRDQSLSEPKNGISTVGWELFNDSTGLSQGSSPSSPGGEVSFAGLAPASYRVKQTVFAKDGSSQGRTYGPLSVGPM